MTDIYDIELQAFNEVRETCCDSDNCKDRYWGACIGLCESLGYIEGCAVAVSKYYAILGRLRKELADNG